MRIAETASHHPFQDHELGISRHVPEREYAEPSNQPVGGKVETDQGRGNLDPITSIMGAAGGMHRTPIPVAESTRQPGREILTPCITSGREGPEYRSVPMEPRQTQEESAERDMSIQRGEEPEWALPEPSEPCRPPGGSTTEREVPFQPTGEQEEKPLKREYSTPEQ